MSYEIRQLSFGEILDQGFKILKGNFVPLTGMLALIQIPLALAGSVLEPEVVDGVPTMPDMASIGGSLAVTLIGLIVFPLVQLAVIRAVADLYLDQPFTLGSAFSKAKGAYLGYLGTTFLMWLFLIPLGLMLVVPAIYFMIGWMLVGPVAIVESTYGMDALKRSRVLTKGFWWRCLGIALAAVVLAQVVASSLGLLLNAIPYLGTILTAVLQSIAGAYSSVVLVLIYFDLRCRKEDFDLHRLASVVGDGQQAPGLGSPAE